MIKPNRILSAAAIGFPLDEGPQRHWISFREAGVEIPAGMAYCKACHRLLTSQQWASEVCDGITPPEADEGAPS